MPKKLMIDAALLDHATDLQREHLEKAIELGNFKAADIAMGKSKGYTSAAHKAVLKRAAKAGYAPEYRHHKKNLPGFGTKRISTARNADGDTVLEWHIQEPDKAAQLEMMQEAIRAMCEELPKLPPVTGPLYVSDDLMAIYPLGDPHIGMLSWAEETGQDWDLAIAEKTFCTVFDRLVKTAPNCASAIIINLGDYFHYDNMEGTTSRSKHSLDTDGRYAKMVKIGVKIMRQMISSALEHHAHVRVINAIGNHDDTGALFLSVCLANIYENDPRVTVDQKPAPFHYIQFGKCMGTIHHGHTCKMAQLPSVMASDQAAMWGATEYRYGFMGHVHHDEIKEFPGAKVESFRTLAAKDAYATWNGYRAGQDSKCIVWNKHHGEVERHTVNISVMREDAA